MKDEGRDGVVPQSLHRPGRRRGHQHRQGRRDKPPWREDVGHGLGEGEGPELRALIAGEVQGAEGVGGEGEADQTQHPRSPSGEGGQVVPGGADGGVDQYDANRPVRLGRRQFRHEAPAQRMADQDRTLDAQRVEDLGHELAVGVEMETLGGQVAGAAVPGQVDRHHLESESGQPGQGLDVEPSGEGEPVDEDERDALATDGQPDLLAALQFQGVGRQPREQPEPGRVTQVRPVQSFQ
jgi:hypothetical protein